MWKQKDPTLKTIADIVHKNTGLSDKELLDDETFYKIKDIDKVAEKIKEASKNGTKITIVGDYDCDGISATSILVLLFKYLKINYEYILPKRFKDGYGLNKNIVDRIDEGILITVDNGIVAFDAIKKAKGKGLFVIVTDHHQGHVSKTFPEADILIDPSAIPGSADYSDYCGAGIAYKIAEEILGDKHPLLKKLSAIAAFGTVADMVPLTFDNRKIVSNGLKNIFKSGGRTMGMYKLLDKMYIKNQMTSTDIAFGIGPAINATGRLEGTEVEYVINKKDSEGKDESEIESVVSDASLGVELLTKTFDNFDQAEAAAQAIIGINNKRKELKREQFKTVLEAIDNDDLYGDAPLVVYAPGLHLGIVGILAGELVETYGKPAIVLTDDPKDPEAIKGSARSIEKVNMKELLDKHAEDMIAYGGHAGAAGLSLKRTNLQKFREDLNEELADMDFEPEELTYDLEIEEADVDAALKELDKYGPFGQGNPEPLFLIRNFRIYPKGGALFTYKGEEHVIMQGAYVNANAFFLREKFDEIDDPSYLDIVCTLGRSWNLEGDEVPTLFIKDLQKAERRKVSRRTKFFEEMEKNINTQGVLDI